MYARSRYCTISLAEEEKCQSALDCIVRIGGVSQYENNTPRQEQQAENVPKGKTPDDLCKTLLTTNCDALWAGRLLTQGLSQMLMQTIDCYRFVLLIFMELLLLFFFKEIVI